MSDSGGSSAAKGCILVVFLGGVLAVVGAGVALTLFSPAPDGPTEEATREAADLATKEAAPAPRPSPGAVPPALQRIRDRGVLRVAMDTGEPAWTGTPPMFFLAESGEHDGFDVTVARELAKALQVPEVKVVHAKYSALEALLLDPADKVDLLISGYSPTDTPGVAWSAPYLSFGLCLVVPRDSAVRTTQDLFGKPIGIFDDDAAAAEVKKLVKGYTELVRLEDGYWDQLVGGRFAGFLYDYPYAAAEIATWYKQNPSRKGSLRIAQYNLTDSTYAVGVREADRELIPLLDRAIDDWTRSETYGAAVRAYLSGGEAVDALPADARTVEVRPGDTLSLIAQRELGSVEKWTALWEKNRDRFPNPHLIDVGDKVVLP